ncbi:MAG: hypothetical protein LBI39_04705 [Puniceicoccales bacterium]|jgi:ComF family protein|nr:hypothetical protein [Puniceicoccales bacterium]
MGTGLLKKLGACLLDALWPRSCFGCGSQLASGGFYLHLCERCVGNLNFVFDRRRAIAPGSAILSCRSLFEFNGFGREIVHEIKYRAGRFLLPDIGAMSRIPFGDIGEGILVPVPIHWKRRWRRGFNQSELICDAFAAEHRCRRHNLLRRVRHCRPQVGLRAAERRLNVEGVFSLAPKRLWKNIARDVKIYLVDDVLTTGATANECAKTLLKEGFWNVHLRTLARG